MKKKVVEKAVKEVVVKSIVTKPLKEKLIAAVHKVLQENKSELTKNIQKVVKRSIKKINLSSFMIFRSLILVIFNWR